MQKTVNKIARLIFATTILVLIVGVFLAEIISLHLNQQPGKDVWGRLTSQEVAIAAGNNNTYSPEEKYQTNIVGDDARPLLIQKYLEKYHSPLLPYSRMIFDLSKTYGFDYYWIPAIAQQESNLCKKIPEGSYNCWGYGIHKSGTLKFDNYELALKSYAEYLKREYFDKGLNTPELIMRKYCPSSNGSWAFGVQKFINEIEAGTI